MDVCTCRSLKGCVDGQHVWRSASQAEVRTTGEPHLHDALPVSPVKRGCVASFIFCGHDWAQFFSLFLVIGIVATQALAAYLCRVSCHLLPHIAIAAAAASSSSSLSSAAAIGALSISPVSPTANGSNEPA